MFRLEHDNGDPLLLPPDLAVTIGRGDQCDLQLNDPSVSRVHCRAIARGGKVTLTDVGSRWGTFVNGQKVTECDLRSGDRLTVGETVLRLELDGDPARTTLAPSNELLRPDGVSIAESLRRPEVNDSVNSPPEFESSTPRPATPMKIAATPTANQVTSPDADIEIEATVVRPEDFLGCSYLRYHIQKTLATTASGVVFQARDTHAGRAVALKIYHPQFFADDNAAMRFERAARTMFDVQHPNIVGLFNAGRKQGFSFTASQLIKGHSAVHLVQNRGVAGMLEPATALQIAVDMCEALRFAESREIVHRNIKPSNILIRESDGAALLNDLILAKATTPDGIQLTQAGEVLGDVSYMSPEQLGSGHAVDCRSDIYQLGATLYAILAGRPPFNGGTIAETISQVLTADAQPVQSFHMATPGQFDALIQKMLAKNSNERIQNADELAVALRKIAAETGQQNVRPREADPKATGWGGALDGLL